METQGVPRLLRVAEVSELVGLPKWRLYDLLKAGEGPAHMKVGKIILIRPAALVEWIQEREEEEAKGFSSQFANSASIT